jgi:hypothetical protein
MKAILTTKMPLLLGALLLAAPTAPAFYNPQPGRWLNRDPQENVREPAYCFVLNQSSSNYDPDGRITVIPTSVVTTNPCGAYDILFSFLLDRPLQEDGYIVQKIDNTALSAPCGRQKVKSRTVYWEAFPLLTTSGIIRSVWDRRYLASAGETHGANASIGEIKFFYARTTGNLAAPASGWRSGGGYIGSGSSTAGSSLQVTESEPVWWNRNSDGGESTSTAVVTSIWNCCCAQGFRYSIIRHRP